MNQKKAEKYVINGIKSTNLLKKYNLAFLPMHIVLAAIAMCLYWHTWFIITMSILIGIYVISSFLFRFMTWTLFRGFLLQGTHLLFFDINLVCFHFALYIFSKAFVWQEYLISCILTICALAIIFLIVLYSARRIKKDKSIVSPSFILSFTLFVYTVGQVLCQIILIDVDFLIVMRILIVLINVLMVGVWYGIFSSYYRAYLLKKYGISIDLENLTKSI